MPQPHVTPARMRLPCSGRADPMNIGTVRDCPVIGACFDPSARGGHRLAGQPRPLADLGALTTSRKLPLVRSDTYSRSIAPGAPAHVNLVRRAPKEAEAINYFAVAGLAVAVPGVTV